MAPNNSAGTESIRRHATRRTYSGARTRESSPTEQTACELSSATKRQSLQQSLAHQATTESRTTRTQPKPEASPEDSRHVSQSWPSQIPEKESHTSPPHPH